MAQPQAKKGRRLTSDARREHLLDLAAAILLEHGFEAVTMEAVKERGKISRGLAYTHFANADDLLFALYEREVSELDRRIATAGVAAGSFEERVRAAIRTYFDFVAERGGLLAELQIKLTGRWLKPSAQQRLTRLFGFWSDEIESEFGVSADAAGALAVAALAASEALAAAWRAKKLTRRDAETLSIAFALGGLRGAIAERKKR